MSKSKKILTNIKTGPRFTLIFLNKLFDNLKYYERLLILTFSFIFLTTASWFLYNQYLEKSQIAPAHGGTYIEGVVGSPEYINPVLSSRNQTDQDIVELVFSGLMKYDENNNLVNDVVSSWSVSQDKTQYTIKLRDNVYFHDQEQLTAEDVIFTLNLIKNSRYNSPLRANWTTTEVSQKSQNEVIFTLKEPFTPFLHNLTFGILPKHIWQDVSPQDFLLFKANKAPIGSGPYVFSRLDHSNGITQGIVLKANKKYHLNQPFIENIRLSFFNSEEAAIQALNQGNIMGINNLSYQNLDKIDLENTNLLEISLPRSFAIFLNSYESEQIANDQVRKALAWATCKDEIIDQIFAGKAKAIYSPMANIPMQEVEDFKYRNCDPDKARELLKDADYKLKDSQSEADESDQDQDDDNDREDRDQDQSDSETEPNAQLNQDQPYFIDENKDPLKIVLTLPDYPKLIETAELLKKQWESTGILTELEVLSIGDLQNSKIEGRNYQALLYGETLKIDPDPRAYWHSSYRKAPGQNFSNYKSEAVDELLDKGKEEVNEDLRRGIYQEFQLELNKDVPAIFLYSSYYLYPISAKVKGVKLDFISDSSKRFGNIHRWYIEEKREIR
ncbi:MAG: hypothetical protein GF332_03430 [Candidatus Moranbacteria bacterium]|nr:hypothetical protein [Candidatus Moranbacteria bacterium]